MIQDFLTKVNPIDAIFFLVAVLIIFNGIRHGALAEFFKLLGSGFAVILCLHYFARLASIFYKAVAIPRAANDVLAFGMIWLAVAIIFKLTRDGVLLLRGKREEKKSKVSWVALTLSILRAVLFCCLLSVMIRLLDLSSLRRVEEGSLSTPVARGFAVSLYSGVYHHVIFPLFPEEKINPKVNQLDGTISDFDKISTEVKEGKKDFAVR